MKTRIKEITLFANGEVKKWTESVNCDEIRKGKKLIKVYAHDGLVGGLKLLAEITRDVPHEIVYM